jgi:hypothetical protein
MASSREGLPKEFVKSNQNFHNYPANLVDGKRWGELTLRSQRDTLEDRQEDLDLFVQESEQQVPILEANSSGLVSHKNLRSEEELVRHIGADLNDDPDAGAAVTYQEDPSYRAM